MTPQTAQISKHSALPLPTATAAGAGTGGAAGIEASSAAATAAGALEVPPSAGDAPTSKPAASAPTADWPLRGRPATALSTQRAAAYRACAEALLGSRILVWLAGSGTVTLLGFGPARKVLQQPQLTHGFGSLGNVLLAPVARWDAAWYLLIARSGYLPRLGSLSLSRSAFFPVYPLAMRAASLGLLPLAVSGLLLSLLCFAIALYLLHRLSALEFIRLRPAGDSTVTAEQRALSLARLAVFAAAFAPMAFFFTAIYSEALFMALSVAIFWCARRDRWAATGLLTAVAGATRPTGILLALPALLIYLYGPREALAGASKRPARGGLPASSTRLPGLRQALRGLRPRYRLRRDLLWLALAPAGLLAFMGYLALAGGHATAPFSAEQLWGREPTGPLGGLWRGTVAAFDSLRQLFSLQSRHSYLPNISGDPLIAASHDLLLFAFALATLAGTAGVLRRLPAAYGAYVLSALALALSEPAPGEPLMSLPRFALVLFPLYIWLALWLGERPVLRRALFVASALALCFFSASFATWHWVS